MSIPTSNPRNLRELRKRYEQSALMPPKTIPCNNSREGAPCGEAALVHMIHYIYDLQQQAGDAVHVLTGASYDIDCPRCGRREQIVRYS